MLTFMIYILKRFHMPAVITRVAVFLYAGSHAVLYCMYCIVQWVRRSVCFALRNSSLCKY